MLAASHHPAGVYDDFGRELTHGHVADVLNTLLGDKISRLAEKQAAMVAAAKAHADEPDHAIHRQAQKATDNLNDASHARLQGRWSIDRYDAPIEYYAYRAAHNTPYGITVAQRDIDAVQFHAQSEAIRVAADAALKKNHRTQRTEWDETFDNLFTTQGVSTLWNQSAGGGTTNSGAAVPGIKAYFNNAQAVIGIGDSSTAASASQFDLQAATNRLWIAMDATFPTLPSTGSNAIVFRCTAGSTQAQYAWAEFAVANDNGSNVTIPGSAARSASNGSMLDRVVSSQGTKGTSQTWQPSMSLSVS